MGTHLIVEPKIHFDFIQGQGMRYAALYHTSSTISINNIIHW